ncbi:OmpH family outer membrane protein [Rhodovulum imhoffii]|nr:OmpH family outer membrane protein [Rhodovulum imhoffii]
MAGIAVFAVALGGYSPVCAQEPVLSTPIVTVDQERLFTDSAYGAALLKQIHEESTTLAAENREIEAELIEEERALTDQRASLPPEDFRNLAQVFDEKVISIRQAQDAKTRALAQKREVAQQEFFQAIVPILTQIVRERRAVAVLETRAVVLSADQIDITDEAIARIDARLGETSQ